MSHRKNRLRKQVTLELRGERRRGGEGKGGRSGGWWAEKP